MNTFEDIPIFTGDDSEPEFNGPVVQQDPNQKTKKIARHKLIADYKIAS